MTREEWVELVRAEAITPRVVQFPDTPVQLMSHAAQVADADAFIEDMIRRRVPGSRGVPVKPDRRSAYAKLMRARSDPGPSSLKGAA